MGKKIVKKGKAEWKMKLDELKEQTIIFFDNHYENIDKETKWMIEFIVRNFGKFLRRNKIQYTRFNSLIWRLKFINEQCLFEFEPFMKELIDLNADILKLDIKNSLTDGAYRYPRCPHFKSEVKYVLKVVACHYLEETKKDYLLIFICNDCKEYIDYYDKVRKCISFREDYGRNFREIVGCLSVKPLNFSMY